jgi:hypothetical protein
MRVFISSTLLDLVEHRRTAANALERLGLHLARMETFGARPDEPTSACLADIDASELFVGIYAHRYGYVPSGSAFSITELEFDRAMAVRRPTFCYFVDEGYSWPGELVEGDPGETKLRALKAKIETSVVRDAFTTPDVLATRIAASVGRFLIADPRKTGATSAIRFARLAVGDLAAAAFVDVMRLICVAASAEVRAANSSRWTEFVDTADSHFSDYRIQVTRLVSGSEHSDSGLITQAAVNVERGIAWAITRLRRGPQLDRPWHEFVRLLRDQAERIKTLAEAIDSTSFAISSRQAEVAVSELLRESPQTVRDSPEGFARLRFTAQSRLLARMRETEGFAPATVRDDMDLRLAVPYFSIDCSLLGAT